MKVAKYTRWAVLEAEESARTRLERAIAGWGQCAGLFSDPDECLAYLSDHRIEVLFANAPPTFFDRLPYQLQRIALGSSDQALEHAQQGIDGFILTPIRDAAVQLQLQRLDRHTQPPQRLWVRQDSRWLLIDPAQVRWAEHRERQVYLYGDQLQFIYPGILAQLHQLFPQWLRIHRHLLIAPHWVTDLGEQGVKLDGYLTRLPVSRRQRSAVRAAVLSCQHGLMRR